MKISIILPSVRENRLERFINSIDYDNYELIIVGPYPTLDFKDSRITVIEDYGSPVRASQIALHNCDGDLILWAADDAVFKPGVLAKAVGIMKNKPIDCLLMKYTEGGDGSYVQPNGYFTYFNCYPNPHINNNHYIFNVGICRREMMLYLGGWDCKFEACPLAHADFGIRSYLGGFKIEFIEDVLLHCDSWDYPDNGDHSPIERAQLGKDSIYFREKDYLDIRLPIDNWKSAPRIWKERFSNV